MSHSIGTQFRIIHNLIKRSLDVSSVTKMMENENVTGTNAWLIGYLAEHRDMGEDVFQKNIEEEFCVTRSSVSKVVKLMEQKGMVRREPVEHDARLKKLVLTKKSEKIAEFMKHDSDQMEAMLTTGFSAKELEQLSEYLERIRENMEHQTQKEK